MMLDIIEKTLVTIPAELCQNYKIINYKCQNLTYVK